MTPKPETHGFGVATYGWGTGIVYQKAVRDCSATGGHLAALSRPTCPACAAVWDRRHGTTPATR